MGTLKVVLTHFIYSVDQINLGSQTLLQGKYLVLMYIFIEIENRNKIQMLNGLSAVYTLNTANKAIYFCKQCRSR